MFGLSITKLTDMKKIILLLLASLSVFTSVNYASNTVLISKESSITTDKTNPETNLPAFINMKMKELEKMTGRKFNLLEKIQIKLAQKKYRRGFKKNNYDPMDQDRQANWSFIAALLFLGFLGMSFLPITTPYLLGIVLLALLIGLSIVATWFGIKSVKDNKNFKGIFGIIVGGGTIAAGIVIAISALFLF